MSNIGPFQDVEVDFAALDWLVTVSRRTASALEQVAADRRRAVTAKLARCRGPFVQQLQEQALRRTAEELELAECCRRLAEVALAASAVAYRDQVARVQLRSAQPAGPPVGHAGGGGNGEGW